MPIAGGERGVGYREDTAAIIRDDFGYVIEVRENAPDLPRRALSRMPVGFVGASNYQSAVRKFGPSRRMLEACLGLSLPAFVLDRLPLVLRDLDLLQAINRTAVAVVGYSINSTPDSPGCEWVLVYPLHRRVADRTLAQIKTPIKVLEPPARGTS